MCFSAFFQLVTVTIAINHGKLLNQCPFAVSRRPICNLFIAKVNVMNTLIRFLPDQSKGHLNRMKPIQVTQVESNVPFLIKKIN